VESCRTRQSGSLSIMASSGVDDGAQQEAEGIRAATPHP
jgi:hypothetical protein